MRRGRGPPPPRWQRAPEQCRYRPRARAVRTGRPRRQSRGWQKHSFKTRPNISPRTGYTGLST
eukprot:1496282-Lingulodinium_polyedra.AAC.1